MYSFSFSKTFKQLTRKRTPPIIQVIHSRIKHRHHKEKYTTLIDASKEIGLEVNREKTKYMLLSRRQNAGQNHDIKIRNRCFENVAQFRY
jgi:oligoendopeptidase F